MYYLMEIEDKIRIPPTLFGSEIEKAAKMILREKYEGRIFKETGVVLSVDDIKLLSEGIVIPGDGGAYYKVAFKALTFLPQVNDVHLAEIKEIVEFGAFASIGPFQGLLHLSQIAKDKFYYDKKSKALTSKKLKKSLKKGDKLIVKVSTVSLKSTSAETKIGLTTRPEGLGKIEWLEGKK